MSCVGVGLNESKTSGGTRKWVEEGRQRWSMWVEMGVEQVRTGSAQGPQVEGGRHELGANVVTAVRKSWVDV
eukprot:6415934-Prymnesium_polylepis.2